MATELVKADQLNASFQGMTQLPVVQLVQAFVSFVFRSDQRGSILSAWRIT